MGVLKPLKLVIENFPAGETRAFEAPLHPEDPMQGTRSVSFSNELWIEQDDFREDPPKDWFRLAPGREVRLRYACLVTCNSVVKNERGEVVELRCTWDPNSWGGTSPDGRTVRGTLHWVSAAHAVDAEVRLYDRLFSVENPGADEDKSFVDEMNPESLVRLASAKVELHLARAAAGTRFQLERLGYFCVDADSTPERPVLNRTVTLKDSWAKIEAKAARPKGAKPAEPKAAKAPKPPKAAPAPPPPAAEISVDDLFKVDLRVGIIRSAEIVAEAQKLLRLVVDLGETGADGQPRTRQIFSGIRAYYPDAAALVGKSVVVVANLKPRQMKFGLSEGMILAAGGPAESGRPHRVLTFDGGEGAPEAGDKIALTIGRITAGVRVSVAWGRRRPSGPAPALPTLARARRSFLSGAPRRSDRSSDRRGS